MTIRWDEKSETILIDLYGRFTSETVTKMINRECGTSFTRTAVRCKAQVLGLSAYDNQGMLTVNEAARTLGINASAIFEHLKTHKKRPPRTRGIYLYITESEFEQLREFYKPVPPGIAVVTVPEAARMLKCSNSNIYELIRRGRLKAHKQGERLKVYAQSVEQYRWDNAKRKLSGRQTG